MIDADKGVDSMTALEYKTVEISLTGRELTDTELEHIDEINDKYSDEELKLELHNYKSALNADFEAEQKDKSKNASKLLIKLRKLNPVQFDEIISELADENSILHQVRDKIASIKSYEIDSSKKRVYVGYNRERKVKNRQEKELRRGKFYYAKNADFNKEENSLPEEYKNQIICADSEEFLKQLPDNCVDLTFTSPPYNFGLEYADHQDSIDWESYLDKLYRVFQECIRVTKFGGRIVVNVQPLFSDYIPIHHFISNFFIQNKLIWKAEILWEKNNYNCKYTAWGSWKSPSKPYMKYTWEFLEVFCKGQMKKPGDKEKIDISGEEFKNWVYGKWSIATEKNMKEFDHPSMFPEELARRVMKLFSYQEDVILDPFAGSGTTPVVAKKNNRYYLGIDVSQEYCDIAEKRLQSVDPGLFSTIHHFK